MTNRKERTTKHESSAGFMTLTTQKKFIQRAIEQGDMPPASSRILKIVSLDASRNQDDPLYFWQLFSVLGTEPILRIVKKFYQRVFDDPETWFRTAFSSIAPLDHHVQTQAAMWIDCFGGGYNYHGGHGRLNFHHENNAKGVMTQGGAERWTQHMIFVLDEEDSNLMLCDKRARMAINSFLEFFMDQYAKQFKFEIGRLTFGKCTQAVSLRGKSEEELQKTPTSILKLGLVGENVDISDCLEKHELIRRAMALDQ